jgi:XTP/dITP diphosphohydrolase
MILLWIASFNSKKMSEFKALAAASGLPLELHLASELVAYSAPPETGNTFYDNALIKAKSLKAVKPEFWVIADDSGLEVEALGGLPGVHSARYAGPKASDAENLNKLLKILHLKGVTDRRARFHCSLVTISPAGEIKHFEGQLQGQITTAPKGQMGFGYDPIFIPEGQTQTLAELGPAFKNQHSHRARAFQAFLEHLKSSTHPEKGAL